MRPGNHNFKEAQTTLEFLLGPVKIKDGLFMGDQFAAKDIEFIISNKVTHIINTVSKSIPNLYERFGIQYLSVHWTEREENIFDKKNNAVNAIFEFVEEAMSAGESCLIHSMHGKSRACAVLAAYLMKKYSWSLTKTLEFANSKKEGLQIRNNYLTQMQELEKRMMHDHKLSLSWNEIKNQEDLILANTYYNAKKIEYKDVQPESKKKKKKVQWSQKLIQKTSTPHTFLHSSGFSQKETPISTKKLKSILKGQLESERDERNEIQKINTNNIENKTIDQKFVSTINGNVVHVTVNNFIQADKQMHNTPNKVYNTRPYSSDTKERDKRGQNSITGKMFPSDTSMSSTLKNPYERHLMGKIGSNLRTHKKREDHKNLMMIYDRPISAKTNEDKRKTGKLNHPTTNPLAEKLGYDMVGANWSGKKRFPSASHKEESFKWK